MMRARVIASHAGGTPEEYLPPHGHLVGPDDTVEEWPIWKRTLAVAVSFVAFGAALILIGWLINRWMS